MISIAPARANDCNERVTACEQALDQAHKTIEAADKVIDLKTKEITAQSELIHLQDTQINDLKNKQNSIFNNPWLYLAVGFIAGALIVK